MYGDCLSQACGPMRGTLHTSSTIHPQPRRIDSSISLMMEMLIKLAPMTMTRTPWQLVGKATFYFCVVDLKKKKIWLKLSNFHWLCPNIKQNFSKITKIKFIESSKERKHIFVHKLFFFFFFSFFFKVWMYINCYASSECSRLLYFGSLDPSLLVKPQA